MSIKKVFQPIVDFLQTNENKKVSSVLPEVLEMCEAKKGAGGGSARTFIRDVEGQVIGIKDYYFKRWMPLVGDAAVEYGAKKNSASGFNTMCKEGVKYWTKQQNDYKKGQLELLNKLEKGEIEPTEIADARAELENARTEVVETDMGFETKADLLEYLAEAGYEVPSEFSDTDENDED